MDDVFQIGLGGKDLMVVPKAKKNTPNVNRLDMNKKENVNKLDIENMNECCNMHKKEIMIL